MLKHCLKVPAGASFPTEVLLLSDMVILKHDLVPSHRILSQKEKEKVLDKYNISKFQLPTIKLKDPALKGLTVKDEDMVEINRKGLLGDYTYYRRVIE